MQAECYTGLAGVYDQLTANYDYERWIDCVLALYRGYYLGRRPSRVLDLGCGTGRATAELAARGSAVVGVDVSEEMLAVAAARVQVVQPPPLLIRQDIRRLNLGQQRFELVVSLCDTLNYLLTVSALTRVFTSVAAHLQPGGVLVFDLNTEYKLATVYGDNDYVEEGDGYLLAWENSWEPRSRRCDMRLHLFTRLAGGRNGGDALWRRTSEIHRQRAHDPAEVTAALQHAGFTAITGPLAAFDLTPADPTTERVFYAAVLPAISR